MILWLLFSLMTAAAIFAVLWPLSRSGAVRAGNELAVYRDQLDEIARDHASGLIGEAEADAARIEVSRRLIAAGESQIEKETSDPRAALSRRRAAAVVALAFVPFVAGSIYLLHGSPQLPGAPRAERMQAHDESVQALIAKVESHLEQNPNDARGWEVLAPVYLRLGRLDEAVRARRNALRLGGETAQRQADLGEALVAAANGVVTAEAKQAFDRAVALGPADPKSRFYLGLAAQQDGDSAKATEVWQALLKGAPTDAPWVPAVRQALASLGKQAPIAGGVSPSVEDIASANQMSEEQRDEMIHGMVARLADRLKQDGSDVEGWLRLVRAYMVLGDRDKANGAIVDARRALASDPDKVRRIDDLAKGLGLSG